MTVGQIVGMVVGGVAGFLIGGPFGAYVGANIGMMIGGMVDPPKGTKLAGPANQGAMAAQYGTVIPVVIGEPKAITGNCIYYGNFQSHKQKQKKSGKGGLMGGGAGGEFYTYSATLVFGLSVTKCSLVQILVNGVDYPSGTNGQLFYDGTQTTPNAHLQTLLTAAGRTRFPIWKGLCYTVMPNVSFGTSTSAPRITFRLKSEAAGNLPVSSTGVNPSSILKDAINNEFYGLGKDPISIDSTSWDAVVAYNNSDDMKLSLVVDNPLNFLDYMSFVLSHHNGVITYNSGALIYTQLSESMVSAAVISDVMCVKNKNAPYSTVIDDGESSKYNKITVQFQRPDGTTGTTYAADLNNIDNFGLRDVNFNLQGLGTYDRANKMAQRILNSSLSSHKSFSAKLGLVSLDEIATGTVVKVIESVTGYEHVGIVTGVSIGTDYIVAVEIMEVNPESYAVGVIGSDLTPPPSPNLYAAASSVTRVVAREIPAQYSDSGNNIGLILYSQPDEIQWAESVLYKSYEVGANYTYYYHTTRSSVSGTITATGSTNGVAYIQLTLDNDDSLESSTDFDTLLKTPDQNLCGFVSGGKDIFVRFEDATLVSGTTWKLENLIYDVGGFPGINTFGSLINADVFYLFATMPYVVPISNAELGKTLYFKPASANFAGTEQALGDVTAVSLAVVGVSSTPLTPVNIVVNGIGIDSSDAITTESGNDIVFAWDSRNRKFSGMTDYARTDTSKDDLEYESFYVEICQNDGITLIRPDTVTAKTWTYTAAMQTTDGNPTPIKFYVRQKNSSYVSLYADTAITITII